MSSLNVVALNGRVGSDPEIRYFESGACKATLSLAVDGYANKEKITHWIPLEAWGKTAEVIANYVTKGKQIGVQGSLRMESWEDKDGQKRSRLFVHVDQLQLLGSKDQGETTTAVAIPAKQPVAVASES
jgi:single-strand DNA-binding protein